MDTLTSAQQDTLNQTKASMRMSNEQYIRSHPELKHAISCFMSSILKDKPEDTLVYAAKYFTQGDLEETVLADSRNPTTSS